MVSVIIPILNEEKVLSENVSYLKEISKKAELLFVDGGSLDNSGEIAADCGKLLRSKKGRGSQMNAGALCAKNSCLLFLHADTKMAPDTLDLVEAALDRDCVGGCLTLKIEKEGFIYRAIEVFGNIRARMTKVFYGDQGIFTGKEIFLELGGFPEVPIMEDVLFTKKLRARGETIVLRDKLYVSPRRWESHGVIKTSIRYCALNIMFWLKVPLDIIKSKYDDVR